MKNMNSLLNPVSQHNPVQRNGAILRHDATLSPNAYFYTNPLLDICTENPLIGLAMHGAYSPLFDFIGAESTNVENLAMMSLTYMGVEGTAAGTSTLPWQVDPCDVRQSSEWGGCMLKYNGFGRLSLKTPTRDITQVAKKKCEVQPEYFYDGTRITDELQWDFVVTSKSLVQSLHTALIEGNRASGEEQFDGLERLVKTGYTDADTGEVCSSLDSIVIDYASNTMCPPDASPTTGITWNGDAVTDGTTLIQLIEAAVYRIMHRASMSTYGDLMPGNMVIVMPNSWIREFLDCYTCDKYCKNNNDGLDSIEARAFRESLNGGLFNKGFIRVGSMELPVVGYDHGLINVDGTADMYILTNKIGQQPLMRLEYNDMRRVVSAGGSLVRRQMMWALDDGLVLALPNGNDGTCDSFILEMHPRLVMRAPWAQARIQNVARTALEPVISGDPTSTFYFESNLIAATTTTTTTTTTAP